MTTVPKFGGMQLVERRVCLASTGEWFKDLLPGRDYFVRVKNMNGSASGGAPYLRFSTDNGVTEISAASSHGYSYVRNVNTTVSGNSSLGNLVAIAVPDWGTLVPNKINSEFWLIDAMDANNWTRIEGVSSGVNSSGVYCAGTMMGHRTAAEANNAFKIYPSSGTMTGVIELWELITDDA